MKLYVIDRINGRDKISLDIVATDRVQLANKLGSSEFYVHNQVYHVNDVFAISDSNDTAAGAVIGGVIGLLGGPAGVAIGGLLGGAIGNSNDNVEAQKVKRFNQSYYHDDTFNRNLY